jgi:hypothetical protein
MEETEKGKEEYGAKSHRQIKQHGKIYTKRKLNLQSKRDKIITEWVNKRVHRYRKRRRKIAEEASKKGVNLGARGQRIGSLKGTVQLDYYHL